MQAENATSVVTSTQIPNQKKRIDVFIMFLVMPNNLIWLLSVNFYRLVTGETILVCFQFSATNFPTPWEFRGINIKSTIGGQDPALPPPSSRCHSGVVWHTHHPLFHSPLMYEAAVQANIDSDWLGFVHAVELIKDAIPEFQIAAEDQCGVKQKMSNFLNKRPEHLSLATA